VSAAIFSPRTFMARMISVVILEEFILEPRTVPKAVERRSLTRRVGVQALACSANKLKLELQP
jgi:hypothetical protein